MSRIQVAARGPSLPIFADGTASFAITDTKSGEVIALHRFRAADPGPNTETYYDAQRQVAQRLADALNEAGDAALDALHAEIDRVATDFQFAPFPPAGHRAV